MSQKRAIIIGAGIAGLAASIRLAVKGYKVQVFEKNDYPGGKLSSFTLNGYHFDAGPSLFTQPENIEALFKIANEPIDDYFHYESLPLSFKYFYEDGILINAYTDTNAFAEELHNKLGEDVSAVKEYLSQAANLYDNIGTVFLNYSLHKTETLFQAPIAKALKTVQTKHLFSTMDAINQQSFQHPHTVQLFNRYATYNGSNPYDAPGMLTLIPHLELSQGTYYPKGGMIEITNALYRLALKKGVEFHFNSLVEKIETINNKAGAVVANGIVYHSDIIVSNMDAYFTYNKLLNLPKKAEKILKQERSSSACIFYWGIKQSFNAFSLHNILFSKNYKAEFEALFKTHSFYDDPTIYINITSKCEPGIQAPMGKENWFVMVNAPSNIGQDWEVMKQQYKQAIIQKINRMLDTDIEPLIEVESILDPVLIESKTASYQGALYGTSSNSKWAAFLRHSNFSNTIKGLYFVGGSVHPGGGIPLCLKSAEIMSNLVS